VTFRIERALLSVTKKDGIVEFARGLAELGVEILSTGGTAALLEKNGVPVIPLEQFTGMPEMLDGRVKTLHPIVHGGILHLRDNPAHLEQAREKGIKPIDLVCVNLYDFDGAVAKKGATFDEVIENIDIGGPTLLRAAAKNHPFVLPVVDPADYPKILEALRAGEAVPIETRRALALKVYQTTSRYDASVSAYFLRVSATTQEASFVPEAMTKRLTRIQALRYGENPHQNAGFFRDADRPPSGLSAARQLQGKELSYNNILDLDSALGLVLDLGKTSAVYIKHNNPCGAATRPTLADAVATARACDPVSAYGAVIAVNQLVDKKTAEVLTESFMEAVLAPAYGDEALEVFAKKANVRVLALEDAKAWRSGPPDSELRQVRGGFLVQTKDLAVRLFDEVEGAKVVTRRAPSPKELEALAFAWAVAKHVRSNAIVFGQPDRIVAVGAGQMSRVDSVKLCVLKGGGALKGTAVASDAFFPFRDGVDVLAEAGASAIVQPGGSIRDEEVIRAADEHGVAMIFTGVRHFRH
jgi:phosphoribosylaminoimidazolecarboxamide formyltransferase / IMP cyclohydrolase